MTETIKRGTRITYSYAAGAVVQGKIVRPYAADMPDWFLCELTDDVSGETYRGGCHVEQITITDNRV